MFAYYATTLVRPLLVGHFHACVGFGTAYFLDVVVSLTVSELVLALVRSGLDSYSLPTKMISDIA